ncbi:MAG TPA: hypothetical protein EYP54_02210 [Anaerolineales bacterium]|nr:hypothetical protein [Anaerolineales bacterium]
MAKRTWWPVVGRLMLGLMGLSLLWAFRYAQEKPPVVFDALEDNQAVQGRVPVRLRGPLEVVREVSLDFAYADAPEAWFPLARRRGLPADGLLAVWDTTTLTDGDYLLRLQYTTQDGQTFVLRIKLRVRNYTPIETPTPSPTPVRTAGERKKETLALKIVKGLSMWLPTGNRNGVDMKFGF